MMKEKHKKHVESIKFEAVSTGMARFKILERDKAIFFLLTSPYSTQ